MEQEEGLYRINFEKDVKVKAVQDGTSIIIAEDNAETYEKLKAYITEKNNEIYVQLVEEDSNFMNPKVLLKVPMS